MPVGYKAHRIFFPRIVGHDYIHETQLKLNQHKVYHLSVIQQVVKDYKDRGQVTAALPALERPLTGRTVSEIVNIAAYNTVEGFVAHDLLDFDGAVLHWSQVFHTFCPELDNERVVKAAEAFTNALFLESKIKDEHTDAYSRVHAEQWQQVRDEMVKMCFHLGFPPSFGSETCDSYRYHSVGDDSYVKHVLEFHRVLVKRLTGTERGYRVLAGLYVSAFALHDMQPRTKYVVKKAIELMKFYYSILFDAKYGTPQIED